MDYEDAAAKPLPAARPPFGLMIIEENGTAGEKDITVVHSKWAQADVIVPSRKRMALQWQSVHTYFTHDNQEMFICNICGRDLKLSGSVSAVTAHLNHKHPGIRERLEEMDKAAGVSGAKRMSVEPSQSKKKAPRSSLDSSKKPRGVGIGPKAQPQALTSGGGPTTPGVVGGGGMHQNAKPPPVDPARAMSVEVQKQAQVKQIVGFNLPLSHSQSPWQCRVIETTVAAARLGATAQELRLTKQDIQSTILRATKRLRDFIKDRLVKISNRSGGQKVAGGGSGSLSFLSAVTEHVQQSQPSRRVYSTFRVQWIQDFELVSAVLAVHVSKSKSALGSPQDEEEDDDDVQDFDTKLQEWEAVTSMLQYVVTDTPSSDSNTFGFDIHKSEMEQIRSLDYLLEGVATKAFHSILGVSGNSFDNLNEAEAMRYEDNHSSNDNEDAAGGNIQLLKKPQYLLKKICALVQYFQDSIPANQELMSLAQQAHLGDEGSDEDTDVVDRSKELKNLILDTSTTWWSTQEMLERLLALREAVTTCVARSWSKLRPHNHQRKGLIRPPQLTEMEWQVLDELCFVLRPLRYARQILNGYQYISAPLVPIVVHVIYQALEKMSLNEDDEADNSRLVESVSREMLDQMDLVFGDFCRRGKASSPQPQCTINIHKTLLYAHALDPRFKPLSIFPESVQKQIWDGLLGEMVNLSPSAVEHIPEPKTPVRQPSPPPPPPPPPQPPQPKHHESTSREASSDRPSAGSAELDSLFRLYSHKQPGSAGGSSSQGNSNNAAGSATPKANDSDEPTHHVNDWHRKCEVELKHFQEADGIEPKLDVDVLRGWWAYKHAEFPILWLLAQQYFAISATSAPPGCAFQTSTNLGRDSPFGLLDPLLHFLQENASVLSEGDFLQ